MSVQGTGIAAAVAQTALAAQQVARRRDSERNEAARKARQTRELFETHLQALDEGDESDSPAQLHVDGHLPDHQTPPPQQLNGADKAHSDEQPVDAVESAPAAPAQANPDSPLYRHLDVRA